MLPSRRPKSRARYRSHQLASEGDDDQLTMKEVSELQVPDLLLLILFSQGECNLVVILIGGLCKYN